MARTGSPAASAPRASGLQGGRDGDGGDHRADVGLEDVGAHARDVAHVVAHVIGDNTGVAGVVLGDAGFDLANEVRTDVGGLGVDAAAHTGEQGNRAGAHRKAVDVGRLFGGPVDGGEDTDAQQTEPGDGEPHHRTSAEGDHQGRPRALSASRLAGPGIGLGGRFHADESGDDRTRGATDKADHGGHAKLPGQQRGDNNNESEEDGVLTAEKRHRSGLDQFGDLLHGLVAGRFPAHDNVNE